MGGGACGDFNQPLILQGFQGTEKITVVTRPKRLQGGGVPIMIVLGEMPHSRVIRLGKSLDISRRPRGPLFGERFEVRGNQRIAKLLRQDRCDAHRNAKGDTLLTQVVKGVQERQVRFGYRFVHPFLAMRPHPGFSRIVKMTVKNKGECAVSQLISPSLSNSTTNSESSRVLGHSGKWVQGWMFTIGHSVIPLIPSLARFMSCPSVGFG